MATACQSPSPKHIMDVKAVPDFHNGGSCLWLFSSDLDTISARLRGLYDRGRNVHISETGL